MAVVASESSHPNGTRMLISGALNQTSFLVVVSLGGQGLWRQQVWGGRTCICETSQLGSNGIAMPPRCVLRLGKCCQHLGKEVIYHCG